MPLTNIIAALALSAAAPGGMLAYVSVQDGAAEVRLLSVADMVVQAAVSSTPDTAPAWSPDGRHLAYTAPTADGSKIALFSAESGTSAELQSAHSHCAAPRWNRDGTQLTYTVAQDWPGTAQVAVYGIESQTEEIWGGELANVHNPVWMPALDLFRHLDPDEGFTWKNVDTATLLEEAFSTGVVLCVALAPQNGRLSAEIVIVTRTQAAPLLALLGNDSTRFAEWRVEPNRDGKLIALESNDGGDREIFVLSRRGLVDVSNHRAADWNPVWSHDGRWLAFESFRGGSRGVYKVFPGTMRVDVLYANPDYQCWSPTWSPDGQSAAFLSDRTGTTEVWLLRVGEATPQQLTSDGAQKSALTWQPRGKR